MRQNIKDILQQLFKTPTMKQAVAIYNNGKQLHLCFAADGRRTGNKIGTLMAVFSIFDELENNCDHQYIVALYVLKKLFP